MHSCLVVSFPHLAYLDATQLKGPEPYRESKNTLESALGRSKALEKKGRRGWGY
jgi:hypothetical protein